MVITIKAKNGLEVAATTEHWLCGLLTLLTEDQFNHLAELVSSRVELAKPSGHVITVPPILSQEAFGRM